MSVWFCHIYSRVPWQWILRCGSKITYMHESIIRHQWMRICCSVPYWVPIFGSFNMTVSALSNIYTKATWDMFLNFSLTSFIKTKESVQQILIYSISLNFKWGSLHGCGSLKHSTWSFDDCLLPSLLIILFAHWL